jgi:predicted O-methyltransferase YrrM
MLSLNLPISACIETGTYRGDTTFFLAEQFPNIPIYTIEINSEYAKESRWRLRNKKNVIVLQGSSPEELQRLFAQNAFGNFPLFFLDAHWYDYWPLLDELAVISKIQKAVIIIDDVRIPYRPTFAYDSYYDPRTGEKIDNDIEYIGHALRKDYTYKILMPDYDPKSVSLVKNAIIPGYIIIFQNIEGEDWQSIQNDHIFTNFRLITNNFK